MFSIQVFGLDLQEPLKDFERLYQERFTDVNECGIEFDFQVCSKQLRNKGVAPYILHHGHKTKKVVVLFHGLSDSPYYMKAIAEYLYSLGINVIAPLLPAHGIYNAKEQLTDYELSEKWIKHVDDVMAISPQFGDTVIIGGFSTGGALAVDYTLTHPQNESGIMLFSGALALSKNAENLSKIWGVKWLARWLDRNYESEGPNPYKYSSVPNSAGIELMEVIEHIRELFDEGKQISQPVFVAHSQIDNVTPVEGIQAFLTHTTGQNTVFYISQKHQVCHGDLVLDRIRAANIKINKNSVDPRNACAIPKANPVFENMKSLMSLYINEL